MRAKFSLSLPPSTKISVYIGVQNVSKLLCSPEFFICISSNNPHSCTFVSPPPSPASHVYEYFSMVPLNIKSLIIINRERGLYGKILNRGFMLGGSQCNVLHCVLWRHLYVDLQLCVLTIYWTTRMNTDRTKC